MTGHSPEGDTQVRMSDELRAAIDDGRVRMTTIVPGAPDPDHPFQIGRTGGDRTPPPGLDADGRAEWFRKYDNGARYHRPPDGAR